MGEEGEEGEGLARRRRKQISGFCILVYADILHSEKPMVVSMGWASHFLWFVLRNSITNGGAWSSDISVVDGIGKLSLR